MIKIICNLLMIISFSNYSFAVILKESSNNRVSLIWSEKFNRQVIIKEQWGFIGTFLKSEVELLRAAKDGGVNVPAVLDFSEDTQDQKHRNKFVLTMEYTPWPPLRSSEEFNQDNFTTLEKFSLADRYSIVKNLVKQVSLLHKIGIKHNDLNLSNILAHNGELQLIDFGAAFRSLEFTNDIREVAQDIFEILTGTKFQNEFLLVEKSLNSLGIAPGSVVQDLELMVSSQPPTLEQLLKKSWLNQN